MDVSYMKIGKDGKLLEIPNMDNLCEILKAKFEDQERCMEYLRQENTRLKSEHYKDEELAKLKAKIKELESRTCFDITEEEVEKINKWQQKHLHYAGAVGGNFVYSFTPTSIGTIGSVRCSCGDILHFRDLD